MKERFNFGTRREHVVDRRNSKSPNHAIEKEDLRNLEESLFVEGGGSYYRDRSKEIKSLKPVFVSLTEEILEKKPDYLIFLDKGARVFGTPFLKHLHELETEESGYMPQVRYWNDSPTKNLHETPKWDGAISEEYQRHPELIGKKLFFIDEVFYQGTGASHLKDIFDKFHIDGTYIALTYLDEGKEWFAKGLAHDERFIVYDRSSRAELFSKKVGRAYLTDSKEGDIKKRFVSVSQHSPEIDTVSQSDLKEVKETSERLYKKTQDTLNTVLAEVRAESFKKPQ